MSEDNSSNVFPKTHSVLGDVTNRLGKRGFSLVWGNSVLKSRNGYEKPAGDEEGDSHLGKQACIGVENWAKENCVTKFARNDGEKVLSLFKDVRTSCSLPPVVAKVPIGIKEPSKLSGGSIHSVKGDAVTQSVLDVGDASRDSCASTVSLPTFCGPSNGRSLTSNISNSNPVYDALATQVSRADGKNLGVGNLASSKHGSLNCLRSPNEQGAKNFGLERCTGRRSDDCSNSSPAIDLLKHCSCSFCMKAAFIWSDLYYQDIKGRMAALKKSQKEASVLIQKSCRNKETEIHGLGNGSKPSKLESDLMAQWRSLLHHMEDVFVRESNQLQASALALKDWRDNCKTDLELINGLPQDKHQCVSNASRD